MKTIDDYRREVLQDYHQKKNANLLDGNLAYPTPAKLREECIRVCETRFSNKDDKTLASNFGLQANAAAYSKVIWNYPIDKFKPLANWLNGKAKIREEKKVELLAWLIDFKPRPFRFNYNDTTESQPLPANTTIENIETLTEETLPGQTQSQQQPAAINVDHDYTAEAPPLQASTKPGNEENIEIKSPSGQTTSLQVRTAINWKKWMPWLAALLIACISIYFTTRSHGLTGNPQCMYWAGDHYQPAACNEKVGGLVALDTKKTAHFKKIDRKELSHESLGKVWYVQINGIIEFYTDSGFHPTQSEKRLLPLTDYILNKPPDTDNVTDRDVILAGQAKNGASHAKTPKYIEVFLNIDANDKVLINGQPATADEISDKPNTLKLVIGKHYRIKINNCPEQEIIPTTNTALSVCM